MSLVVQASIDMRGRMVRRTGLRGRGLRENGQKDGSEGEESEGEGSEGQGSEQACGFPLVSFQALENITCDIYLVICFIGNPFSLST